MYVEAIYYNYHEPVTIIVLAVRLANNGTPTVASGWQATYKVGASSESMRVFLMGGARYFDMFLADGVVRLRNQDLISTMTINEPIVQGGSRCGRLLLELQGNLLPALVGGNFTIEVKCFDNTGNPCISTFVPNTTPIPNMQFYPHEETIPNELGVAAPNVGITSAQSSPLQQNF